MGVYLTGVHFMGMCLIGVLQGSLYCALQRCSLPVNRYKVYGNFDFSRIVCDSGDFRFSILVLAPTILICRHRVPGLVGLVGRALMPNVV
jgi:hypothetical protein